MAPLEESDCYICRKHAGQEPPPPGGWLLQGRHFWVCAPRTMSPEGELLVESTRHFLDFGEMRRVEASELASTLRVVFPAIKKAVGAERVYTVAMMDGVPHFHLWLVPRGMRARARGVKYLAQTRRTVRPARVTAVVRRIRSELTDVPEARRVRDGAR